MLIQTKMGFKAGWCKAN